MIEIPLISGGSEPVELLPGKAIVFVGANGSGKTRLGVWLDEHVARTRRPSHRIAAHRSLKFAEDISIIDLDTAEKMLWRGTKKDSAILTKIQRWGNDPATHLLSDFEHVLAALYAQQHDLAVRHLEEHTADPATVPPVSKLSQLKSIWSEVLPHRRLVLRGASVTVASLKSSETYSASALSDGERVIFYLIAQALLAPSDAVLLVDEPELHIHKSILANIWDRIEGARQDLTFVYITHDLEFATTRHAENKYAVLEYEILGKQQRWAVEKIDSVVGLSEQTVTKILGSRRPILFVEGEAESLDAVVFRQAYPRHTVIPTGGHDQVISAVRSFNSHAPLHRVGCHGIIDRDDHSDLSSPYHDVSILQVSEIENLILLPVVYYTLVRTLAYAAPEARKKTAELTAYVLDTARNDLQAYSVRAARRRLDRRLKAVGLTSGTSAALSSDFAAAVASIRPAELAEAALVDLDNKIAAQDVVGVLALYDNKAMLAKAAALLSFSKKALEEYLARILPSKGGSLLLRVIRTQLPRLSRHP